MIIYSQETIPFPDVKLFWPVKVEVAYVNGAWASVGLG